MKKKKVKLYSFFVYVTRHGCYSETPVLHVGYSERREPRETSGMSRGSYPTWESKSVPMEIIDKIYEKVKWRAGQHTSNEREVEKLIDSYIKEYEK